MIKQIVVGGGGIGGARIPGWNKKIIDETQINYLSPLLKNVIYAMWHHKMGEGVVEQVSVVV